MSTLPYPARSVRSGLVRHRPVTLVAIVLGLLFFGAWPLLWLANQLPAGFGLVALTPAGIWNFLISALVLGRPIGYALLTVGVLSLSLWGLCCERPPWRQRFLLLVVMGALLAFVFLPYRPAVEAGRGYDLMVVTHPAPWFNGLARAQATGEHQICTYDVLGWQADALFYTSTCISNQSTTWRFVVGDQARPTPFTDPLPILHAEPLPLGETWETVKAFAGYPPDVDLRRLYVRKAGLRSPDGKWTALVAEHLYSRQDVVLVSKE